MKKEKTSLIENFYKSLIKSYETIFIEQNGRQHILDIIKLIEDNKPILEIAENEYGSFSTIFLPFHGNAVYPYNFKKICREYKIDKRLIVFCKLSGEIEGLTDKYASYEREPSKEEKMNLYMKLKKFIKIFPNYTEFQKWLQ